MSDDDKPVLEGYARQEQDDRRRISALHAAIQIEGGKSGDYQGIIRAAREILAFLKDG